MNINVLNHPLRVRILVALSERRASPSELASEWEVSLGVVSYHVRRLEAAGLIRLTKKVPRRGAVEHYYRANKRSVGSLTASVVELAEALTGSPR